jgi:hypothetical protein
MKLKHVTIDIIAQAYKDKATLVCQDGDGGDVLHHIAWVYKSLMDEDLYDDNEQQTIRHNLQLLGFTWTT